MRLERPTGRQARGLALAAALSAPTLAYLTLGLMMPPQYHFVIQDAAERNWPIVYAIIALLINALLLLYALRSGARLTFVFAALVSSPLVGAIVTVFAVAGPLPSLLISGGGSILLLTVCFQILRRGTVWSKLPSWMRSTWPVLGCGLVLYLGVALASSVDPLSLPRRIGSFALLAVFIGTMGVFLCIATMKPRFGIGTFGYLTLAGLFFGSNNHSIPQIPSKRQPMELEAAFLEWIENRRDLQAYRAQGLPYPVILVSSEGGGIYAAAHAYGTLSSLAKHCATFSQHVFATIGVSGGAIGNALFSGTVNPVQRPHEPCTPRATNVEASPVVTDHLSPVLARLLFIEPIDRFLPGQWMSRDRAQILTDSFLDVAPRRDRLSMAISDSFDPHSAQPAMISVAVDVASGRRLVMAPFQPNKMGQSATWWPGAASLAAEGPSQPQISVFNAAGLSARFPWITPTGRLRVTQGSDLVIADGGYFDNSGADTVADLIYSLRIGDNWQNFSVAEEKPTVPAEQGCERPAIKMVKNFHEKRSWVACTIPVFLIHLALASSDPEPTTGVATDKVSQSFILDPIAALLATRGSRGEIALQRADLDRCGTGISGAECLAEPGSSMGFFRNDISPQEWKLPLGWYMSSHKFNMMLTRAAPLTTFDYRQNLTDDRSDLELMIFHLDPALYATGAKPDIGDVMPDP